MNMTLKNRIDWVITLIPFLCIVALCLTFFTDPAGSSAMVDGIRAFLGEEFGWYYLTLGLGIFLLERGHQMRGVQVARCLSGDDEVFHTLSRRFRVTKSNS